MSLKIILVVLLVFLNAALSVRMGSIAITASQRSSYVKHEAKAPKTSSNPMTTIQSIANEFITTLVNAKDHLQAGAAARGISIFLLYPLDTIKTRLQISPSARASLPPLHPSMLFRGVLGSLTGQIPYGMLTFGSYEVYKSKLLAAFPTSNTLPLYIAAAILGDLTGSFWLCPSEVVKQQLQSGMHKTFPSAVRNIYSTGGLGGFYRGYAGQIFRDVPFRAVQLPTYELVKQLWIARIATTEQMVKGKKVAVTRPLRAIENMGIGIIAGIFSAAVTTPLDVIKTRLMTETGQVATLQGAVGMGRKIFEREGFRGLFSGIGPRVVYVGPSVGVFFVVYEGVKLRLKEKKERG